VSPFSLTCYLLLTTAQSNLERKLFGEEVEAVLQRLDRLTPDEPGITVSQTLEVVHGLVQNMRVVMDGGLTHSTCTLSLAEYPSL